MQEYCEDPEAVLLTVLIVDPSVGTLSCACSNKQLATVVRSTAACKNFCLLVLFCDKFLQLPLVNT